MADDAIIGFKFDFSVEDVKEDSAVWEASDTLFNEAAVDPFSAKAEPGRDSSEMIGVGELQREPDLDNFDFTEGFDFVF